MMESHVWSKLIEFAEGKMSQHQWRSWWDSHEVEIESVISPLEFGRIRPHVTGQMEAAMDDHCHREVCHLLSLQGIEFIVGETGQHSAPTGHLPSQSKTRFAGLVDAIAEEKFSACVPSVVIEQWFVEFLAAPKHDAEYWIEQRLAAIMRWVSERPQWNSQRPHWPWVNGQPLVFISQTSLPENDVTQEFQLSNQTLYVFARCDIDSDSSRIVYEIVVQPRGNAP